MITMCACIGGSWIVEYLLPKVVKMQAKKCGKRLASRMGVRRVNGKGGPQRRHYEMVRGSSGQFMEAQTGYSPSALFSESQSTWGIERYGRGGRKGMSGRTWGWVVQRIGLPW